MKFDRRQLFRTATGALAYASSASLLKTARLHAEEPIRVGTTDVAIGATIGIAFADPGAGPGGSSPDQVVQRADSAMYEAKVAGRGRYAVYEEV